MNDAQIQAAFKVVLPELMTMVQKYVPYFFQQTVRDDLQSPEATAQIKRILADGYAAAEKLNV